MEGLRLGCQSDRSEQGGGVHESETECPQEYEFDAGGMVLACLDDRIDIGVSTIVFIKLHRKEP